MSRPADRSLDAHQVLLAGSAAARGEPGAAVLTGGARNTHRPLVVERFRGTCWRRLLRFAAGHGIRGQVRTRATLTTG